VIKKSALLVIVCLAAFRVDAQTDSRTYGDYSVGRWMHLDINQKYSLVFQMRRAIRLGMRWGHRRAAGKGLVLTLGDESPGAGCLLHASTYTIIDKIDALVRENPGVKEWGLFQAVAAVALVECESYGDSTSEFDLD